MLALLLFISNIMMAVLVSIASILIAEKDMVYFQTGKVVSLILLAIADFLRLLIVREEAVE